jgi:hypothetical protein
MAESFLKKLASTLTRFMLRCTCLGWRVASTPKTSTSPVRKDERGDNSHQRALPAPVGPEDADDLPFPDRE